MADKRIVFKVNRPNFQAKSSIVEKTLEKQNDIEKFFCNIPNPDGLHVRNIITSYIATILRKEESKSIIDGVPKRFNAMCEDYAKIFNKPVLNLSNEEKNQLYAAAWIEAYQEANALFDKYYRGRGNELRIGAVVESGMLESGEEIYFDDIDSNIGESENIEAEAKTNG